MDKPVYQHKSVLVREVVEWMDPQPNKVYVDVTFGGGGHTRALLAAQPKCRVIGFDWDLQALEHNAAGVEHDFPGRFTPIWGNFAQLPLLLKKEGITQVDGILADFGTSQHQIHTMPGFSFSQDTPLDMRMSQSHHRRTAAIIVNRATEEELAYIIFTYGEESYARRIARAIVEERKVQHFTTTGQLVKLIKRVVPSRGYSAINPATKTFQALRIAVNHELDNIEALLTHSRTLLKPDGRLVCISFHSLEDRIVKQFLRDHKHEFSLLTPKSVTAQPDELAANASSRSARLRAAKRL